MVSRFFCLYLLMFFVTAVSAEIAGFPFESESQEQRFRDLSTELRCLVCQNQSLADSNAGLAQDLRTELYEQVLSNNSSDEIIRFMTERYGDFILYKPRFATKTLLLWFTPILLFIVAVFFLIRFSKFRNQSQQVQPSEEELKKVRELLKAQEQKK
ncbi:MAG: cytochrome c-type biogenesis protein CcmH [Proteobacteria bacterium]|nr:cytochrome c-type biogenesis protein CcmH [Pseudomonadota bacterium]NOG59315.1 cytochrome c-type biogenesis protein CcmH [Pseudomonadota bacterium]